MENIPVEKLNAFYKLWSKGWSDNKELVYSMNISTGILRGMGQNIEDQFTKTYNEKSFFTWLFLVTGKKSKKKVGVLFLWNEDQWILDKIISKTKKKK